MRRGALFSNYANLTFNCSDLVYNLCRANRGKYSLVYMLCHSDQRNYSAVNLVSVRACVRACVCVCVFVWFVWFCWVILPYADFEYFPTPLMTKKSILLSLSGLEQKEIIKGRRLGPNMIYPSFRHQTWRGKDERDERPFSSQQIAKQPPSPSYFW